MAKEEKKSKNLQSTTQKTEGQTTQHRLKLGPA